jgi:phage terminase large subunit-like protein
MGLRGPNARPVRKPDDAGVKPRRRRASWRKSGLTRAERVVKFIEGLMITSGRHAGRKFKLRPWQRAIIEAIYSTDATGRRLVRQALITVPRKNGKTQLAAALALCHLAGPEAQPRGQTYSAASDRKQAALIYTEMLAMVRVNPELSERVINRDYNKSMEDAETGSTYLALSCDARKAHGLSPSFVVCDELAQWHGRDLYDNLATGTGAHDEPLMVVISTMSPDPNHVMSELVQYGERVRDGDIVDPAFHPVIYAAGQDADPWSEETWFACNPALADFRSLEEFRVAAEQAARIPAREPAFRLLYLNQAIDAASRFLNGPDWRACAGSITTNPTGRCYLGLDLSSTTDLTALAAFWPETGECRIWAWAPADTLQEAERRDRAPYPLWARQGLLEVTPGRAIDKSFVVHRLGEIVAEFDVVACAYDRWGIAEIKRLIADEDIKLALVEFGQGFRDMSPALAALETLVLQGRLKHPGNPVLDWAVSNAIAVLDPAGGRKLDKSKSTGRIDALQALAMAVGLAARTPAPRKSVYRTRGVLSVGGAVA